MKLRSVRALLPSAKVMALSATLSTDGQSKVSENLGMVQPKMICLPPARENISIVVSRRPSTITTVQQAVEFVTEPIFKELLSKEQDFPLTVLYFSGSQNWLGLSYEFAMRLMGPKMFQGGTGISHARIVQFHASLEKNNDTVKNTILKNLADDPSRSPQKIVLATVALGMGADLQHVRRVINIGPPKQFEAYVQQMGRAGRNGQQSTAILFFNSSDVGRPEVSKQMKTFCKNEIKCRRQLINQIFGFQRESTVPSNRCCDICNPELSEAYQFSAPDPTKGTLRVALMAFLNQQKTSDTYQKLNASTIQRIVSSSEMFTDTQTLTDECDLDQETAHVVATIIKQIAEFKII